MLLDFKVKNYKSFQQEVSFSMIPAPKQKGLDYSVFEKKIDNKRKKAICSSVIYGPNAAGKTNIIGAMDTMRAIVLRGHILNIDESSINEAANCLELIPNNKLKERKPVCFYISFIEDNYWIEYSFSMNIGFFLEKSFQRVIIDEKLCINDHLIFNRKGNHVDLKYTKKLADLFMVNTDTFNRMKDIVDASLNSTELFLMNGFKLILSRKIVDLIQQWFKNKFMVIYKANAIEVIRRFEDTNSPGFYVEKTTNEAAKIFGLNSNAIGYMVSDDDHQTKLCSILNDENNQEKIIINAKIFESYGTIRFINLFPLVLKAIYTGGTLVIDEFDASIHPMALMNIINIFHDDEINIHHAQLIFDSHNPIFLNSNLFRRDEIKFVERNEENDLSDLYCLSDFKTAGKNGVRKNEDYMKNYFISQYGAICDIDFSPIFKELISKGDN